MKAERDSGEDQATAEARFRASEEKLRESEERYRTLAENIPLGLYRRTPGPKGRIVMANRAMALLFGFEEPKEMMDLPISTLYWNPAECPSFSNKVLKGGEVFRLVLRMKRRDGSLLWGAVTTTLICDESGQPTFFDGIIEDITERKLAREEETTRRAKEMSELRDEYASFKQRVLSNKLEQPEAFDHIITRNAAMQSLFRYTETIALTPRPILITGDTGVGKELIARAIHNISKPGRSFVAVNVAGLDDNMFSDTLFGHVKGAFTGADKPRRGLIERAAGGTLFLDEIGDLEAASQIKLLRVLQEEQYFTLGSDSLRHSEARIIVATNRDLNALQDCGTFRRDLYYRLQTHSVNVPPLMERLDDIPLLVRHFVDHAAKILHKQKPVVPGELIVLLQSYDFPGNIRELEGMVFDAVSRNESGGLSYEVFRDHIARHRPEMFSRSAIVPRDGSTQKHIDHQRPFTEFSILPRLAEAPAMLIEEALRRANGSQAMAAQLLGITRSGLSKAMKRYGMRR